MEGGQIIITGITTDAFKEMLSSIVDERVSAILNKKQVEEDAEKLLSGNEAVKLFTPAISRKTLENWTKLKLISSQKIGRKVFYKKSEVLNAANDLKKYKRN